VRAAGLFQGQPGLFVRCEVILFLVVLGGDTVSVCGEIVKFSGFSM
jgi:hypothetical protein